MTVWVATRCTGPGQRAGASPGVACRTLVVPPPRCSGCGAARLHPRGERFSVGALPGSGRPLVCWIAPRALPRAKGGSITRCRASHPGRSSPRLLRLRCRTPLTHVVCNSAGVAHRSAVAPWGCTAVSCCGCLRVAPAWGLTLVVGNLDVTGACCLHPCSASCPAVPIWRTPLVALAAGVRQGVWTLPPRVSRVAPRGASLQHPCDWQRWTPVACAEVTG